MVYLELLRVAKLSKSLSVLMRFCCGFFFVDGASGDFDIWLIIRVIGLLVPALGSRLILEGALQNRLELFVICLAFVIFIMRRRTYICARVLCSHCLSGSKGWSEASSSWIFTFTHQLAWLFSYSIPKSCHLVYMVVLGSFFGPRESPIVAELLGAFHSSAYYRW